MDLDDTELLLQQIPEKLLYEPINTYGLSINLIRLPYQLKIFEIKYILEKCKPHAIMVIYTINGLTEGFESYMMRITKEAPTTNSNLNPREVDEQNP